MNPEGLRIGQGYDIHKLVLGRKLILGGVAIPARKGLQGHSDADVLTHSLADAILGAVNLGDLGKHFPENDGQYKDVSSLKLLRDVVLMLKNFKIINTDSTIVLEAPKIACYIQQMQDNIARTLGISPSLVSIKATTKEGLGEVGRGLAVEAFSTVLLYNMEL